MEIIFFILQVLIFDPSHRIFDKPNPIMLKKVIDENAISLEVSPVNLKFEFNCFENIQMIIKGT